MFLKKKKKKINAEFTSNFITAFIRISITQTVFISLLCGIHLFLENAGTGHIIFVQQAIDVF